MKRAPATIIYIPSNYLQEGHGSNALLGFEPNLVRSFLDDDIFAEESFNLCPGSGYARVVNLARMLLPRVTGEGVERTPCKLCLAHAARTFAASADCIPDNIGECWQPYRRI
jgi:hypothetical protein